MTGGVCVLGGKCPGGKCPGGKCPGGMCPWGKCPGGTCPGGFCPVTQLVTMIIIITIKIKLYNMRCLYKRKENKIKDKIVQR